MADAMPDVGSDTLRRAGPTVQPPNPADLASVLSRNIDALQERRSREDRKATTQERIAEAITKFTGSMAFVYIHVLGFGLWTLLNLGLVPGVKPWDPTFVILATEASVEGIFLSTFVLISQNRAAALADKRADLDLQINLLSEHEITRLLSIASADASQENGSEPDPSARRAGRGMPVLPRLGARTLRTQLAARTRLEVSQLLLTPAFGVLLLLGLINAAGALWRVGNPRGGTATTAALVIALAGAFQVVPIVVAGFFAGELMWNERERRVQDLIGATPLAGVALVLPKLLALAATLLLLACVAAATAAAIQLARHGAPVDLGGYLSWYVLPAWFDWLLFAVLALFLQAASAGKLAGWGWTVLYLILALTLQKLGVVDPRYRYGLYPGWPLPGALSGAADVGLYRLYWGAAATMLGVAACCLGGRGSPASTSSRLGRLLTALRGGVGVPAPRPSRPGTAGLIAAAAALTFVVIGAWLIAAG